jgi:hypothetical protein
MFITTARQITALGLAAIATLAILGSIGSLAVQPSPRSVFAAAMPSAPLQVVVIEGKRITRS